ncbi:MAG: type II toxin-antitoxin system PrlF family antitoxin [Prochlorothrix sp.]
MTPTLAPCSESTLTDRYQTTIPAPVRKALGLSKNDKICYTIHADGRVWISRLESPETDPVLEKFLDFLAQDMASHPQHLQALSSEFAHHIQTLVAGVEVDLEAMLSDEDD